MQDLVQDYVSDLKKLRDEALGRIAEVAEGIIGKGRP